MSVEHAFSNGTEFMYWDHHNCCRCVKGYRDMQGFAEDPEHPLQFDPKIGRVPLLCDIQAAIAAHAAGDPIPDAIAVRWGISQTDVLAPNCKEFVEEVHGPDDLGGGWG